MPDWSTIVTGAGVLVALVLSLAETRRRSLERRDEIAGQARLVTVDATGADGMISFTIYNDSQYPVYGIAPVRVQDLSRVDSCEATGDDTPRARLAPGQSFETVWDYTDASGNTPDDLLDADEITVRFCFLDHRGIRWLRSDSDEPRRLISKGGLR